MTRKIGGLLVLIISFIVYLLTLEPTTSMWDCSEFIACAYGLEVGHAPGAPVFMLLGRFFSLFALDPSQAAFMINLLSATASAFTIFFLFHTIYWFGQKLLQQTNHNFSASYLQQVLTMAAFLGAMSFAFTDTFWFSAVEGEVYATSSLFTAVVFWSIIRWEQDNSQYADRWLLLIFFLLGLSVGIHLLNLLALPAVALVYYFKKFERSTQGIIITLALSVLLMVIIIFGFIPGVVAFTAHTDRLFVNTFGLPVYSGALFFIFLLTGGVLYAIHHYRKKGKITLHFIALAFALWLAGYSSFTMLIIRSNQQPYIDINNVENIYGLVDYLNREQYPKRPLFYGNNYNSPLIDAEERYTYKLYQDKYVKDLLIPEYKFNEKTKTFFPRMASLDPGHARLYEKWIDIDGRKVRVQGRDGKMKTITVPTFADNLRFFFKYQLGYMYGRYFMWNFAGRQNNIQGTGEKMHGNWQSGINFIDNARLIPAEDLPSHLKDNKASNKYYLLPLLLGLLGLIYQWRKDKNNVLIVITFFLLTGAAIVFYLNEIPRTPRERDYAFVGSFYVFAIWIGLGALQLLTLVKKSPYAKPFSIAAFVIIGALVPGNLLSENYDDHDRSGRYTTKAHASNMLSSCQPNAIMFTAADNDSYPVWYMQEVEQYRTDVLPILKTFLPTNWYIRQLHTNFVQRGLVETTFKGEDFLAGKNMSVPVMEKRKKPATAQQVIDFVKSEKSQTKVGYADGSRRNYIPVKNIILPVDKANFIKTAEGYEFNRDSVPSNIQFRINAQSISADELIILDIIANNDWERPIYFLNRNMVSNLGLAPYVHREGLLYRLMPYKTGDRKFSNADYQHELIMNQFQWGGVTNDIYLDWTNVRMFYTFDYRGMFSDIAKKLASDNENRKAIEVLDKAMEVVPTSKIPWSYKGHNMFDAYMKAGDKDKAKDLLINLRDDLNAYFIMYKNLPPAKRQGVAMEVYQKLYMLRELYNKSSNTFPEEAREMMEQFGEINALVRQDLQ
ncbi:MAG TPA: DUF2723 domain-containing protein [Salinivirga sp.]|uniref:glycosyltransferase family 117 protein n=1 Tax=Salinivirga sp. TaxID=1970192 RepID=UPI002B4791A5|nr:DUF2723 domain-containing protein [Salinivirga sp.]HKK58057.1 DUF2723 domain-containing protein [Salinivirga sp.]